MKFPKIILLSFFIIILHINSAAQSCGFGCLGFSGFSAGYSFQQYNAPGLNKYINTLYGLTTSDGSPIEFGSGKGFRLGVNIFRAKFDNYFVTAKGFYQFLDESHQVSIRQDEGLLTDDLDLGLNYWGFGMDFGIPVFSFLDIKLIEGGVTFYNADLKSVVKLNGNNSSESKFESTDFSIGYYAGTGVVFHIVPDYLSIEGTALFNILTIDRIPSTAGNTIPLNENSEKFIDRGGLTAIFQLNLGVPL